MDSKNLFETILDHDHFEWHDLPYPDGSGRGGPASSFSKPLTFGVTSICCTRKTNQSNENRSISIRFTLTFLHAVFVKNFCFIDDFLYDIFVLWTILEFLINETIDNMFE